MLASHTIQRLKHYLPIQNLRILKGQLLWGFHYCITVLFNSLQLHRTRELY